jgi:phosphatidate cytidylyltransferase
MYTMLQNNLLQRVVVALVGIPVLLWINMTGGLLFFGMVFLLSLMATWEFRQLAIHRATPPALIVMLLLTAVIQLNFYFRILDYWEAFIVVIMLLYVSELWRQKGSAFLNIGSTLVVILYVNLCFGALLRLRLAGTYGESMVLLMFLCVWAADIFAYFGGRSFGGKLIRKKLFARISPKKTWEGYLVGIAGSVIAAWFCSSMLVREFSSQALAAGLIIGVVGPAGDLMESMFKRDAGVKDSSGIIPGHGGVLDRFDTIMFTAPVLYFMVTYGASFMTGNVMKRMFFLY